MALPTFVALKSNYNNKYLRYKHEGGETHGFLQFSGDDVVSSYTKFEIVPASSQDGLVHIQCSYNNKYWVRWSENHWWMVAMADKPEEDRSKWLCTLFEPMYIDKDAKTIRFRHVQLQHYACLWRVDPPYGSCLFAGAATVDKDQCDVYTIIDWESVAPLPNFLALKSIYNKKYLCYKYEDGETHGFLQFSGDEVVSSYTKFEVVPASSQRGLIHIRCCYNNKYWVRWSENHWWIVTMANKPEEDRSKWSCTLFEPMYIDKDAKTIRFRHVQIQHYACLWRVDPPYDSCLYGGATTVDKDQCDVYTIIDWESIAPLPKFWH